MFLNFEHFSLSVLKEIVGYQTWNSQKTRAVRKVLRLLISQKVFVSQKQNLNQIKDKISVTMYAEKEYICSDMNGDVGYQDNPGNAPRSTSKNMIFFRSSHLENWSLC